MFYSEFMNKIRYFDNKDPLVEALKYSSFRKFLEEEMGRTKELVLLLSKGQLIKKPYRLLVDDPEFFVGVDMNTNFHCIYYRSLMMIDVDNTDLEDILKTCKDLGDTYIIYSSRKGYHIFVVNRLFEKDEIIDYMLSFKADINYIVMSYVLGFSVRLNKKEPDDPMYVYITTIGTDFEYQHLVDLHIDLTNSLKDVLMYERPDTKSLHL